MNQQNKKDYTKRKILNWILFVISLVAGFLVLKSGDTFIGVLVCVLSLAFVFIAIYPEKLDKKNETV